MKKDFVEITPISGSNNGSFNVVCEVNKNTARSTVISVEGGGISKTINVNQNINDKVYPLAYYIFPFTVIENYTTRLTNNVHYIFADAHITKDVIIADNKVGLYNLKAFKSDIDLVTPCIVRQVGIGYDYNATFESFMSNVVGSSSSTQDNGVGFATIPENDLLELTNAIKNVIDSKKGYILVDMMFGTVCILYRINILSN